MASAALIAIRLLGVLCGLYALALLSGIGVIMWHTFSTEGGKAFYTNPMLGIWLWVTGMAALALRIAWLVWYRLTPMTVRHLGFFVGLMCYQYCTPLWNFFDPTRNLSADWLLTWRLAWPIGLSIVAGCLFSHVFRRWLYPVATPPSWLEKKLRLSLPV